MARTRDTIRFVLDGKVVEARDVSATTTVLEYLRDSLHRTGTKEGCAEGDCGACTVVLGALREDAIHYRAINACIRYLPTIDGQELVTCESLADGDTLHPVQQAIVDQHASQCGFCTPGFVMSLFALYQARARVDRSEVVDALAGNLCRCTGYRPIIAAGEAMHAYPRPQRWARDDGQAPERRARLACIQSDTALQIPGFIAPRSLEELTATLAAIPDAVLLAGGTDVGLWSTKQLHELPALVYLGEVRELQRVEIRDGALTIGAAVTLSDAWHVIVRHHPELAELALRFASPPVCNSGTLCGNVANGSPVGDAMPALMALGAHVELRKGATTRSVPLERFYLGYRRTDLQPGEFVQSVAIPARTPHTRIASYKVSKRFDQDIAAVCVGIAVEVDAGRIQGARIAFGGMAPVPARAVRTEQALRGEPWTRASIETAIRQLDNDFQPLTDLRATHHYRLQIAGNLLRRFFDDAAAPSLHETRFAHG